MGLYLRTIILSIILRTIIFLLVIFEIVIEQAYLEHGYLMNSRKSAKSANRQLRAMGDLHGIDEFSYVIGEAEHVRGILFDIA